MAQTQNLPARKTWEVKYMAGDVEITLNPEVIKKYLVRGKPDLATLQELTFFMGICRARGLNPFAGDCYLIKYTQDDPAAIITSIDFKRARARLNPDFRCRPGIQDPRVDNDNKKHLLIDIIAITICAVICKCETWYEIAEYGLQKQDWLNTFLKLPNGIPSHDTFRRVFMILNPKGFNRCFLDWTRAIAKKIEKEVIAIDGKTVCGTVS